MPDPIIDRDAIIEKAARVLVEHDADRMTCYDHMGACCPADGCAHGFTSRTGHQAAAVLPSISDDLLAPIEALHYAAYNDTNRTPLCDQCHGKAGVHECGCWADADVQPVCGTCWQGYKFVPVEWPCPTAQAVAAIREAVRA